MKKRQIYALMMAGVLATGTLPVTAMAAEEYSETQEAQETQETEAATEPETVNETETVPKAPPETEMEETEMTEESEEAESEMETEEAIADTGISVVSGDSVTAYGSLKEAVDYVQTLENQEGSVIEVSQDQVFEAPVEVTSGKVVISAKNDVHFTRTDGFTGSFFSVKGGNLSLKTDMDGIQFVVGKENGDTQTTDPIVSVEKDASFSMENGVTLTGNVSDAEGSAITNKEGTVSIEGGSITGNTGKEGAVYSNTPVNIQGSINVSENKNTEDKAANLYMDNTHMVITGVLEDAQVDFSLNEGDVYVAEIGKDAEEKDLISQDEFASSIKCLFSDVSEDVTLSADGASAVLDMEDAGESESQSGSETESEKESETQSETQTESQTESETQSETQTESQTESETQSETQTESETESETQKETAASFKPVVSGVNWADHGSIQFTVKANAAFSYYCQAFDKKKSADSIKASYSENKATKSVGSGVKEVVTAENLPENSFQLYLFMKTENGMVCSKIPVNMDSRPKKSETRTPDKHTVDECTVSGLDQPLKLFPGKFYEFAATGIGGDKNDPVEGDEKYEPIYWSIANPAGNKQFKNWKLGSADGIKTAHTGTIYVYFQKYVFTNGQWKESTVESKAVSYSTAAIAEDEWNNWKKENGVTYGDGNGVVGDDVEDSTTITPTEAASEKDADAKQKDAVKTGDNTPIGAMVGLAAVAAAAVGGIAYKKKRED